MGDHRLDLREENDRGVTLVCETLGFYLQASKSFVDARTSAVTPLNPASRS